jgi:hypothetical protein
VSARLEGNPLGKALAWTSGGLVAVLVALGVIWALPPSGTGTGEAESGRTLASSVPQLAAAESIEKFTVITDRPIFNESRQPVIGVADEEAESEDETAAENVDAPDVELAGVVITPDVRVATLRLKDSPESLLAFEGQPLEGNYGSWYLSRIEPRQAILESNSGEQVKLELQIHDAMIDEPPKPAAGGAADGAEAAAEPAEPVDPNLTRAEEIRQRIQQRREELRRAAEEGGDPQAQQQQTPQVDYRQAIQAMMAGRKDQEDQKDDDSEQ